MLFLPFSIYHNPAPQQLTKSSHAVSEEAIVAASLNGGITPIRSPFRTIATMMDLPGNRFQASPLPRDDLDGMIRFCHPGYSGPPASNTFLSLPRVDPAGRNIFGVHYYTALVACQIIANNAFRPSTRLTLDRAGERPAVAQWDSVLTERFYYFHVGHGLSRCRPPFVLALYLTSPYFFATSLPHSPPLRPPLLKNILSSHLSSISHCAEFPRLGVPSRPTSRGLA